LSVLVVFSIAKMICLIGGIVIGDIVTGRVLVKLMDLGQAGINRRRQTFGPCRVALCTLLLFSGTGDPDLRDGDVCLLEELGIKTKNLCFYRRGTRGHKIFGSSDNCVPRELPDVEKMGLPTYFPTRSNPVRNHNGGQHVHKSFIPCLWNS